MTLIHVQFSGAEQNGEKRKPDSDPQGCDRLINLACATLGRASKDRIRLRH